MKCRIKVYCCRYKIEVGIEKENNNKLKTIKYYGI